MNEKFPHWVEQYHQVGYRYDLSYCRAGTLDNQAAIRARAEKRARHPRVRMNKLLLAKKYQNIRKKKASALENEDLRVKVKQERRENAIKEAEKLFYASNDEGSNKIETVAKVIAMDEELQEMEYISDLANQMYRTSK